jgi:hypothetical protein
MWKSKKKSDRKPPREFTPALSDGLEPRILMSSLQARTAKILDTSAYLLSHPKPKNAFKARQPPQFAKNAPAFKGQFHVRHGSGVVATQTARGGQAVEVTAPDGSHYMINLSYTSNTLATNTAEGTVGQQGAQTTSTAATLVQSQSQSYPQPIGTIRAYAMPGGRVGLIVDGSTQNTDLTINPLGEPQKKGYAHSFAYGESNRYHLLNIGQITINSGLIGSIEGFQDAILSGPLVSYGTAAIDRIAFYSIEPGASITTGGDVNTLDILNGLDLSGANTGIFIGRDLNLLNVGGSITVTNGANFDIARNLGLVAQPPKGTGTGSNVLSLNFTTVNGNNITVQIPSLGGYVQGSINVDPGSSFTVGGELYNSLYVEGSVTAGFTPVSSTSTLGTLSRFVIGGSPAFLLQQNLDGSPGSRSGQFVGTGPDQFYITALGGFF